MLLASFPRSCNCSSETYSPLIAGRIWDAAQAPSFLGRPIYSSASFSSQRGIRFLYFRALFFWFSAGLRFLLFFRLLSVFPISAGFFIFPS
jgi:hypothetical protein